jgi:Protein of unknown function (DUF4231)
MRGTLAVALVCLAPQLGMAGGIDPCSLQLIPFEQASAASTPSTATSHREQLSSEIQGRKAVIDAYLKDVAQLTLFARCRGKEPEPVEGSYLFYWKWYSDHLLEKRIGSQFIAILTIILGASLPVLVQLGKANANYKLWVSLLGAAIVVAQGVGQSVHFDETWQGYMLARMRLESAHRKWEREIVDASFLPDDAKVIERLQEATNEFDRAVATIVIEETEEYFNATARARASHPR